MNPKYDLVSHKYMILKAFYQFIYNYIITINLLFVSYLKLILLYHFILLTTIF